MAFRLSRTRSSLKSPVNRAQFLRGNWRAVADLIRPPWALQNNAFFSHCTQCGDCLTACPESIISADKQGFPQIDFQRGECSFCGDCERICKVNALHDTGQAPWKYHIQINNQCLAIQGVLCRSCADRCDTRAIHFQLAVGGFSTPEITLENCTGCGACIAPCPTKSIEMTQNSPAIYGDN